MVDLYAHAIGGCEDAGKSEDGVHLYALGVEDGVFSHWHAEEPFSLDLHGFSQPIMAMAVRYRAAARARQLLALGSQDHHGAGEPL